MAHSQKRGMAVRGTDKVVGGLFPRILVYARSGSRDWFDRWHRLCKGLGVQWQQADDTAFEGKRPWVTCYDCWGTNEMLVRLISSGSKCIVRWEYATQAPYQPYPTLAAAPREMSESERRENVEHTSGAPKKPSLHVAYRFASQDAEAATVRSKVLEPELKDPDGFVRQ